MKETRIKLVWGMLLIAALGMMTEASAQSRGRRGGSSAVTYEIAYDAPYDINKLWVMFQPVYGELFTSNVNMGFGAEVHYLLANEPKGFFMDFRAHARTAYGRKFDLERDIALGSGNIPNSNLDNVPNIYSYYELGATYHIKDMDKTTTARFPLIRSKKEEAWKSTVPDHIIVPATVRHIYGARAGGMAYRTTVDLDRIIEEKGYTLTTAEGDTINTDQSLFGNVTGIGFYLGGSFGSIKNAAVLPDRNYADVTSDLIFNAYLDIIYMPLLELDDLVETANGVTSTYSSMPVELQNFGVRAGIDGKFNRTLSWAYNFETGWRPSVRGRNFYALLKISFPVYSTEMNNEKESFGK